jgi:predicted transposase YdaD
MSKPYDSVFKDPLERDPAGWVSLALGPLPGEARIIDSDISTVSGAADKVVFLTGLEPLVVHFEAFASWDPSILARGMHYNSAHHRRHLVPVHSVFVVMRPEANHASLTGEYRVTVRQSGQTHVFQYQVLRAWTLDLDAVLCGPLATLPLAPITDAAADRLPEVLRQIELRLEAEAAPETRKDLWVDIFVLLGLRYPREGVAQLFRGIPAMRESDTYQMILEEGMERGLERGREEGQLEATRRLLLLVGRRRLGEPDSATLRSIEAEQSVSRLEEWLNASLQAESWADLPGLKSQP